MAWKLEKDSSAYSTWTKELHNFATPITKDELATGDVLLNYTGNRNYDHVLIFDKWANVEKTKYWGYEQNGLYRKTIYGQFPYPYWTAYDPDNYFPYRGNNVDNTQLSGTLKVIAAAFGGTQLKIETRVADNRINLGTIDVVMPGKGRASRTLGEFTQGSFTKVTPGSVLEISIKGSNTLRTIKRIEWTSGVNTVDFGDISYGDFNDDNMLNLHDIAKMIALSTELEVPMEGPFDINKDGILSLQDIAIVLADLTELEVKGDRFSWESVFASSSILQSQVVSRYGLSSFEMNRAPYNAVEALDKVRETHRITLGEIQLSKDVLIAESSQLQSKQLSGGWLWLSPIQELLGNPYQVNYGDSIDIAVLYDTGSSEIRGLDAIVHYDPSIFDLVNITEESLFSDTTVFTLTNRSEVFINAFNFARDESMAGPGVVAKLTFRVIGQIDQSKISLFFRPQQTVDSNVIDAVTQEDVLTDVYDATFSIINGSARDKPIVMLEAPEYINSWFGGVMPISVEVTDVYSSFLPVSVSSYLSQDKEEIQIGIDDDSQNGWDFAWNFQEHEVIDQVITLTARVPYGATFVETSKNVILDRKPPTVTISSQLQSSTAVLVDAQLMDNLSGVDKSWLYVNTSPEGSTDGEWILLAESDAIEFSAVWDYSGWQSGNYLVGVESRDKAGNVILRIDPAGQKLISVNLAAPTSTTHPTATATSEPKITPSPIPNVTPTETREPQVYLPIVQR